MKSIRAALFVFLFMVTSYALAELDQEALPVGKVIFATGEASIQSESGVVTKGLASVPVYVGQTLSTGAASHLHVQMIDGALLILRPESAVNITYYQVNLLEPANTKILLDMKKGVVRSVTGKGGEANKQGFRLNTPVAAIGIRGTDFTVLANQSISSVSLSSGGVVVAPFSPVCPRYAVGACAGDKSVMLTASDSQMLAEVRAAKAIRVPKVSAVVVPDHVAPAHPAEAQSLRDAKELPVTDSGQISSQVDANKANNNQVGTNTQTANSQIGKAGAATSSVSSSEGSDVPLTEKDSSAIPSSTSTGKQESIKTTFSVITSLSAKNQESLQVGATAEVASLGLVTAEVGPKESVTSELVSRVVAEKTLADNVDSLSSSSETPEIDLPQDVPPINAPAQPQPFYWGRWARYAENPDQAIVFDPIKSKQIITSNRVYLLADSEQGSPDLPKKGKINFALDKGEAGVLARGELLPATISNASLEADFDYNRFKTGLQINADSLKDKTVMLSAEGNLLPDDGTFVSSAGLSNMSVSGAFSNGANQAAYEFHDVENDIVGVASWKR